jgi:alpha-1,6-mannosyltransferase
VAAVPSHASVPPLPRRAGSVPMGRAHRLALASLGMATAAIALFGTLGPAPREAVPAWLGLVGLSIVLLLGVHPYARRLPPTALLRFALGAGLVLRLAALAAPISLSDDVYRYLWDGHLTLAGADVFAARPRAIVGAVPGLTEALLGRLNSPDYYSVYPPLAQLAFALGAAAERLGLDGVLTLRVLHLSGDLATIALLLELLGALGRPRSWALLYALHPLPVWESAAGPHTEALMLPLLLAALRFALRREGARAGALLALAVAAKLVALLAAPLLALHLWRRRVRHGAAFSAAFALVAAAAFLGWADATRLAHIGESLDLYRGTFSFNAPVLYGLQHAYGYVEGVTDPVDERIMPWLAWGLAGVLGVGAAFALTGDRRDLLTALAGVFLGYFAFSRVVHPWYLTVVLALGLVAGSRAVAVLGAGALFTYLRYHPLGRETREVLAIEILPFLLAIFLELAWRSAPLPRKLSPS